jgi:hypothetical protein
MSCAAGDGAAAARTGNVARMALAAIAAIQDTLLRTLPTDIGNLVLKQPRSAAIPQLIAGHLRESVTFRLHLRESFPQPWRKDSTRALSRHNMPPRLAPMAPVCCMGTADGPRETDLGGG